MSCKELYLEYLEEPKNEELVEKCIELQNQAVIEGDFTVYFDVTNLIADIYQNIQDFENAIFTIKSALSQEYTEDYQVILNFVDKLISFYLKTENFTELESILKVRERYITGNNHQMMMQNFYLAVSLEGLKRNTEAITVLESIPDTMSSNNIISKYLKLSMLYLKEKNTNQAFNAFERAKVYDRTQKNSLFALVESDLLYARQEYQLSLDKYQEYFVKSKVKNRYLDRYLLLCTKLEMYNDGYQFFQDYEPKMQHSLSKNYQVQFYEAASELMQKMGKHQEYAQIKDKINLYSQINSEIFDQFDGIYQLTTRFNQMPSPKTPRDILLYSSRILHEVISPSSFQFVTLYDEGYHLFTYSKELLIEKEIDKDYAANSIYSKLFSSLITFQVFSKDELALLKTIPEVTKGTSEMVLGVKLISQFYGDFHILLSIDKLTHYDYIHKLLLMMARLTEEKLKVFESSKIESEIWRVHEHLENYKQIGLIKIEKGYITYIDDISKSILEIDSTYVPFETVQTHFTNKKLYLDDFLLTKEVVVEYELSNNRNKWIRFISKKIDLHLYLFIEEITNEIISKNENENSLMHQINSPLLSINALKQKFEEFHQSTTLIYFVPESLEDKLQNMSYSFKNKLESSFDSIFTKIAKDYFIGIFSSNDSGWILFIKTIDKRVVSRIFLEFQKELNQLAFVDTYLKLKGLAVQVQKKHPFIEILSMINANFYEQCKTDGIIFYDRKMTTNHHLMNTIAYNLNQMIRSDEVLLEYHPVGNWENKKVNYYHIELHKSLLLGENDLFEKTIIYEGMANLFDKLVLKSFIKQSKSWSKEIIHSVRFAIEVHLSSFLNNSFMEDIIKRIKKSVIDLQNIIFIITVDPIYVSETFEQIKRYEEYSVSFGLMNMENLPISILHEFKHIEYVYIDQIDIDFLDSLKLNFSKIVYCHYDNTIKKSELAEYHINYVKGSFFPPIESF